jgi:hypothetical protein
MFYERDEFFGTAMPSCNDELRYAEIVIGKSDGIETTSET